MHPHEEATVRAFIASAHRVRWLESLASSKRRAAFLDRLNHCQDFDERYATSLASNANVAEILRAHGAPSACYVISDSPSLDGREMPLDEAITAAENEGWGTIVSCQPGQLAYFRGEAGQGHLLLERKPHR